MQQLMQHLLLYPRRCSFITTSYSEARRVKQNNFSSICHLTAHRSNSTHSTNNITNNSAYVRSALSAGPIPYEKGWAWQQVLLSRRMNYMRMQEKQETSPDGNYTEQDKDWILMFEHQPVYTLGRGATEDYLTFLNNEADGGLEKRTRLSRKYRGEDASRLNIDRFQKHNTSGTADNPTAEQDEVDELSNQSICKQPVLAPNGSPIYRIERGGEVTYHGPGQLVMYPLLNLKQPNYQQDLHWYLRQIEEVIIQTLLHFDIKSNRDDINTGVWVGKNKIAAVGVSASKWITTHGLALNVSPNLEHFDKDIITPCGIEERGVTSISEVLRGTSSEHCPSLNEVADVALKCFGEVFHVDITEGRSIR
mmetsp:Transcript_28277/g.41518  ORF Transcript_28277/g.41518 Transcript_28277/m.41518 type:complete len:364 (+) Transcript_28277:24-1115(+)